MKTRLRFFLQYPMRSRRFRAVLRRSFNLQTLLVGVISAVFLFALAWTTPYSQVERAARPHVYLEQRAAAAFVVAARGHNLPTEALNPSGIPEDAGAGELQAIEITPTRTPLPPEYLSNSGQSVGITLTASLLVMVVVIGVLLFMPGHEEKQQS